uniref:ORF47 n=1 Tax=Human herpesvirus 3 TaxID=10335 RepID=A0A3G2KRK1_HHV3|nr:ORF47 [Human alphaherpesvirus 3]
MDADDTPPNLQISPTAGPLRSHHNTDGHEPNATAADQQERESTNPTHGCVNHPWANPSTATCMESPERSQQTSLFLIKHGLTRDPIHQRERVDVFPQFNKPPWVFRISKLSRLIVPIFTLNEQLCFSKLQIRDRPRFAGRGTYGRVHIYPSSKIAVKTMDSRVFNRELINAILASEGSIRAGERLGISSIVCLLGFSLQTKQLLFPAYDMDMDEYIVRLSRRLTIPDHIDRKIAHVFLDLAQALTFLNRTCGLTHLDVKCGNIFLNVDNFASLEITTAVIGDYSLVTLNTYSLCTRAIFEVGNPSHPEHVLRVPRDASQMSFRLVLSHGTNQPPEILLDYINGTGLTKYTGTLPQRVGLAIDLYALGQALLEVILLGRLPGQLPISVHRTPHYHYYGHKLSPDLALDTLAYRCVLAPYILPSDIPGDLNYNPFIHAGELNTRISRNSLRRIFQCHAVRYGVTHSKLFEGIRIPASLYPATVVTSLLCHDNSEIRSDHPLLWHDRDWIGST